MEILLHYSGRHSKGGAKVVQALVLGAQELAYLSVVQAPHAALAGRPVHPSALQVESAALGAAPSLKPYPDLHTKLATTPTGTLLP